MKDPEATASDELPADITAAVGAAALGVGIASVTDPAGGAIIGAAATPVLKAALTRVLGLRGRQVALMCDIAAQTAGKTLNELLEQVTTDPHRAQLFSTAARAAANTALESKLRVLGRLLVQGLHEDDQEVHEAWLLTVAIEEIELLHLRVLNCMTRPYDEDHSDDERAAADAELKEGTEIPPAAWALDRFKEELGATRSAVEIVIGTLAGRNLIRQYADTFGPPLPQTGQWELTEPGRVVLRLFREAGEAAVDLPTPEQDDRGPRGEGSGGRF
jgi:hypothetical protein